MEARFEEVYMAANRICMETFSVNNPRTLKMLCNVGSMAR